MSLRPELLSEITTLVRGGFKERDRIVEILCEEMYAPGELDSAEVEAAVERAFSSLEAEKINWPQVTDCDKLDAAFAALMKQGIIALQNAGYTQSEGYDDIREEYNAHPRRETVIGYCFYQGQDLECAVHGGGLYLAFGPIDPKKETAEGPRIGTLIVQQLRNQGFDVQWDGTFNERIHIKNLDWKRQCLIQGRGPRPNPRLRWGRLFTRKRGKE
jgi:hypothetical protein